MNRKALIQSAILCAMLVSSALAQRKYTVATVPGPATTSSTYNVASWISDDGKTVVGAVHDRSIKDVNGSPVGQCYVSTKGNVQIFPTPGYSCTPATNGGANKNGEFAGALVPISIDPSVGGPAAVAFTNLNGAFDPYGAQLPFAVNGNLGSWSTGVNKAGSVVGYAVGFDGAKYVQYGFLHKDGSTVALALNKAAAIHNDGDIAGDVVIPGFQDPNAMNGARQPRNAAIYHDGTVTRLGTLGGPSVSTAGPESSASAVNCRGEAVGWSQLVPADFSKPDTLKNEGFFWDGSQMRAIQIPDASGKPLGNWATSLNDAGEVVGNFYTSQASDASFFFVQSPTKAFHYANGKAVDLNTVLANAPDGLTLLTASYINNAGQILADGVMTDGSQSTYLLTPVGQLAASSGLRGSVVRATGHSPAGGCAIGDIAMPHRGPSN
jgi:hypothetical protein